MFLVLHAFTVSRPVLQRSKRYSSSTDVSTRKRTSISLRLRPAAAAVAAAFALVLSPDSGMNAVSLSPPCASSASIQLPSDLPETTPSLTSLAFTTAPSTSSLVNVSASEPALATCSLQDIGVPSTAVADPVSEQLIDDAEFALSVRLVTAVVLGALVGMEGGAAALSLGVRAVTVTSLTAALGTVCAVVPAGGATASVVRVVPPSLLPAGAAAAALILLGVFAALSPYRPRRRVRLAQTATVFCLAAALGAACAAGQPLAAASAYLVALAVCRSVPVPRRQRRKRPKVTLRVNGKQGTRVVQGNSVEEAVLNLRRVSEDAAV